MTADPASVISGCNLGALLFTALFLHLPVKGCAQIMPRWTEEEVLTCLTYGVCFMSMQPGSRLSQALWRLWFDAHT